MVIRGLTPLGPGPAKANSTESGGGGGPPPTIRTPATESPAAYEALREFDSRDFEVLTEHGVGVGQASANERVGKVGAIFDRLACPKTVERAGRIAERTRADHR